MTQEEIDHERALTRAGLAMRYLGDTTIEIARTLEILTGQVVATGGRPEDWAALIEAMGARSLRYAQAIPADFLARARSEWPKEP